VAGPPVGNRPDHVCLDLDRAGMSRSLRAAVEGATDAIGAFRGEVGRRVEEAEVARVFM